MLCSSSHVRKRQDETMSILFDEIGKVTVEGHDIDVVDECHIQNDSSHLSMPQLYCDRRDENLFAIKKCRYFFFHPIWWLCKRRNRSYLLVSICPSVRPTVSMITFERINFLAYEVWRPRDRTNGVKGQKCRIAKKWQIFAF